MQHLWRHADTRVGPWSLVVCVVVGWGALGCSGDPAPPPTFDVGLFGWTSGGNGSARFVRTLRDYPQVQSVAIKLTKPRLDNPEQLGSVQKRSVRGVTAQQAKLPKLSFGNGLRFDFELRNADDETIATGSTPVFESGASSSNKQFRVMVSPVREFAPVGARFRPPSGGGEWNYRAVTFDGPRNDDLGRIGHVATPVGDGRILITGGGQWSSPPDSPADVPSLEREFREIQIFDSTNGYTTNISYGERRGGDTDELLIGHVHHDVVRIAPEKFVVVGGLTQNDSGQTGPTKAIEMIDLTKDPGSQVDVIGGAGGEPLSLNRARAYHTATYVESLNQIVVVGGIGTGGDDDALRSVEIIDLEAGEVREAAQLGTARAEHATVVAQNSSQGAALWVLGGRGGSGQPLNAAEILQVTGNGVESQPSENMNQPRYDMGVERISTNPTRVVVVGGFTSGGSPTADCQIGSFQEGWPQGSTWRLENARGGAHVFQMHQSASLVVVGGRGDSAQTPVGAAEILTPTPDQSTPYQSQTDAGTMYRPRHNTTATQMDNGMILMSGGFGRTPENPNETFGEIEVFSYYNPGDTVGE